MPELRPFRWGDIDGILSLRIAGASLDATHNTTNPFDLQAYLQSGNAHASRNLWVVDEEGEIIAYGGLRPWHSPGWLQAEVMVHPEWRRQGLGTMVLEQLLAEAARRGTAYVGAVANDDQVAAGAFLRRRGFQLFVPRQHMRLRPIVVPPAAPVAGYWLREAAAWESAQLAHLTNIVYAGSNVGLADGPGYRLFMEQTGTRVWVAERVGEGRPVGLCEVRGRELVLDGATVTSGHIGSLGVDPERRRLGLGRLLLAQGIRYCLECGWPTVELNVDRDNEPALRLYTDLGFRPTHRYSVYRRGVA